MLRLNSVIGLVMFNAELGEFFAEFR